MKIFICISLGLLVSLNVFAAGYIAENSIVTEVRNTGGNNSAARFELVVSEGTGDCIGRTIIFPASAAMDPEAHSRAYASALTAFSTGSNVKIYNYIDDTCSNAAYISISKQN